MFAACLVIIGQDYHFTVFEVLIELITPLPRAVWIGCSDKAKPAQPIHVFFAFANKNRCASIRRQQFRQAIGHAPRVAQLVQPTALAIRLAANEFLICIALDLKEQLAMFVVVIVADDNARPLTAIGLFRLSGWLCWR